MISLLLNCALRSCLFGLLVWALLKSLRIRDTGTETIVWTGVLAVSLSMPLLNRYLPSLVVTIPHILRPTILPLRLPGTPHVTLPLSWVTRHGEACLLATYAIGLGACVTRLLVGLLQSLRLYLGAVPVEVGLTGNHEVRASATLKSPASLAGVILLPADYHQWSAAKREAVIAHEGAHIARGDFFVQLAASVHCAFFWFSPFAWWLQSRLSEIAETASDEAAIQRLDDRVTYAEILLELACGARQARAPSPATVTMARGPFIQQRVENILSGTRRRSPSAPVRALIVGSVPVMALTLASTEAAMAPIPIAAIQVLEPVSPVTANTRSSPHGASPQAPPSQAGPPRQQTPRSATAAGVRRTHERVGRAALHVRKVGAVKAIQGIVSRGQAPISYDPRALLEVVYAPMRPSLPSTVVHDGKTFYVLAAGKPVMEIH